MRISCPSFDKTLSISMVCHSEIVLISCEKEIQPIKTGTAFQSVVLPAMSEEMEEKQGYTINIIFLLDL